MCDGQRSLYFNAIGGSGLIRQIGGPKRIVFGEIMVTQGIKEMMREIMCELYEVGQAREVNSLEDVVEGRFRFLNEQNPASKGSLCHDLEAVHRLEIDALYWCSHPAQRLYLSNAQAHRHEDYR